MLLFDLPERPSFLTVTVESCSKAYYECVEAFLRSIGVNEQNASEYEMRTYPGGEFAAEIWRDGTKVGEVRTRWDVEDGYRFIVECRKPK